MDRRIFFILVAAAIAAMAGGVYSQLRAANTDSARQNFKELCARCHGPEGFGDGPDGGPLATKPRNFHDCGLMSKEADETMFNEIKGGSASIGRSNDMPAWGEALGDDEIRDMIALIRTFCAH